VSHADEVFDERLIRVGEELVRIHGLITCWRIPTPG
jgi:hypothetical protein